MQVSIQTIMLYDSNGEEDVELFKICFDINELLYYLVMYISLEEMLQDCIISRDSILDLTETGSRKILYLYFHNNDTRESIKAHIEDVLRNANYLRDDENYHYVAKYLSEELDTTVGFLTNRNEYNESLELLP